MARPKGSSQYPEDEAVLGKMEDLIRRRKATSVAGAARPYLGEVGGPATADAVKVDRLARKYKRQGRPLPGSLPRPGSRTSAQLFKDFQGEVQGGRYSGRRVDSQLIYFQQRILSAIAAGDYGRAEDLGREAVLLTQDAPGYSGLAFREWLVKLKIDGD